MTKIIFFKIVGSITFNSLRKIKEQLLTYD